MQEKLLKEIILDFAGAGSEKLVDLLYGKKNVNEFIIAKKLDMTINQARNMLYKLADKGLVRFIRKKDKKKGGWYTYFWTLRVKKSLERYKEKVERSIARLRNNLNNREIGRYYYCKNCEIEYNEENAMLNEYSCQECGEVLDIKDNSEVVNHMKAEIWKFEQVLDKINQEIENIKVKEEKSKGRRLKAEQKKKEKERLKRKKEREKAKKKERKEVKKKPRKVKKKMKKKVKKWAKKKHVKKTRKRVVKKKIKKLKVKKVRKKKPKKSKKKARPKKKKKSIKKKSLIRKALKKLSKRRRR